jgi:rod shape-determining protein MreD
MFMRNFFLVLFCVVIVLLQASSAGVFFGFERIPNLVLALAISLVLIMGFEKSLVWIILIGVLADAYSGWAIGINAIILVLIAWAISGIMLVANIKSRRLLFFPALFFLTAGFVIVYDLLAGAAGRAANLWLGANNSGFGTYYFSWSYVLKIVFTALFVYAIYYFVEKINAAFSRPEPSFVRK